MKKQQELYVATAEISCQQVNHMCVIIHTVMSFHTYILLAIRSLVTLHIS